MIGVYIVLKRMAYIGHGLSHAVLGGAVVSFVLSINFLVGRDRLGFLLRTVDYPHVQEEARLRPTPPSALSPRPASRWA